MNEKELVEKLKKELKEWVDEMRRDGKLEGNEEEYLSYENMKQFYSCSTFQDLTNFVREMSWDVESWIVFVLKNGCGVLKISIDDLRGFDT